MATVEILYQKAQRASVVLDGGKYNTIVAEGSDGKRYDQYVCASRLLAVSSQHNPRNKDEIFAFLSQVDQMVRSGKQKVPGGVRSMGLTINDRRMLELCGLAMIVEGDVLADAITITGTRTRNGHTLYNKLLEDLAIWRPVSEDELRSRYAVHRKFYHRPQDEIVVRIAARHMFDSMRHGRR